MPMLMPLPTLTRRERQRRLGLLTSLLGFSITATLYILGCVFLPIIIPAFMVVGVLTLVLAGAVAGGALTWMLLKEYPNNVILATALAAGSVAGLSLMTLCLHLLPTAPLMFVTLGISGMITTSIGTIASIALGNYIFDRVTPPEKKEDDELDTSLDDHVDELESGVREQQVLTLHTDSLTLKTPRTSTASIIVISSAHSTPQTSMSSFPGDEVSVTGSGSTSPTPSDASSELDDDEEDDASLENETTLEITRPRFHSNAS